jgi:hypothetical protein
LSFLLQLITIRMFDQMSSASHLDVMTDAGAAIRQAAVAAAEESPELLLEALATGALELRMRRRGGTSAVGFSAAAATGGKKAPPAAARGFGTAPGEAAARPKRKTRQKAKEKGATAAAGGNGSGEGGESSGGREAELLGPKYFRVNPMTVVPLEADCEHDELIIRHITVHQKGSSAKRRMQHSAAAAPPEAGGDGPQAEAQTDGAPLREPVQKSRRRGHWPRDAAASSTSTSSQGKPPGQEQWHLLDIPKLSWQLPLVG